MSFANLKRNKGSDELGRLAKELDKFSGGKQEKESDDRFWYPDVDSAGNGSAVVRFLPAPEGEDVPFVRMFNHSFKGPTGKWYIENSLSTIGKEDPLGKFNSELWSQSKDDESWQRKQVRAQKRKLTYYTNVYIVKDTAHPENEGKVKIFKFGKKIFDKINDVMNPPEDDIAAINPFDFWEGANFRIRIRTVDKYRNYDKSAFDSPSELLDGDDDKLEEVYGQLHSLKAFVSDDQFKTYAELEKRLNEVLDLKNAPKNAKAAVEENEDSPPFEVEEPKESKSKEPAKKAAASSSDDDDDFSYFQNLANQED